MDDYALQLAFRAVAETATPLDARNVYEQYFDILKDWRFVYAVDDDYGPFKLKNKVIDGLVGIRSIFRGQSLWIIDSNMMGSEGLVPYLAGTGIYFDSNTASYIYSLAYKDKLPPQLNAQLSRIQSLRIDYKNINPYLYLFEARRHFDARPESIVYGRKTFAALTALSKIEGALDASWREMYQKYFREQCEDSVALLFDKFVAQHNNGEFHFLDHQFALIELLLLQTKILDVAPAKSKDDKLENLIRFMDEDLEVMMLRELAICADILFKGERTALTKKLRKANTDSTKAISIVQNCAWDLNIFRIMDWLSNTYNENGVDFYISNLVSCDRDIWGITDLTMLKAIALHNKSHEHVLFPANSPEQILNQMMSQYKRDTLNDLFSYASRQRRIGWTQHEERNAVYSKKHYDLHSLLQQKREELLSVIRY